MNLDAFFIVQSNIDGLELRSNNEDTNFETEAIVDFVGSDLYIYIQMANDIKRLTNHL